mgnify:CR=1 FL=1|jgi:hypothetical protein
MDGTEVTVDWVYPFCESQLLNVKIISIVEAIKITNIIFMNKVKSYFIVDIIGF